MSKNKILNPTNLEKQLFILDEETSFLVQANPYNVVVTSEAELANIDFASNIVTQIIVLAELNWSDCYEQNYYGVELAKRIRIDNSSLCPIVLLSSFPKEHFLKTINSQVDFINSPGIYFILFDNIDKITEYDSIDNETLIDIIESYGGQEGVIQEIIHDIKNKFISNTKSLHYQEVKTIIEGYFKRLNHYFKSDEPIITNLKNGFIDNISSNAQNITSEIDALKLALLKLVPRKQTSNVPKQYNAPWKILFLDDEEQVRNYVKSNFAKRGLTCEVVATYEELLETLKEDEQYNNYTVLICDYRLKELQSPKLCNKQGYSILKEVFLRKPNYLSIFALSSMDTKVLLRLSESYDMKVRTFSKDDIKVEAGFNIFCAKIFREGEKMYNTICNLPGVEYDAWTKADRHKRVQPFNLFYRSFRMSDTYEKEEHEIGEKAFKLYCSRIKYINDFSSISPHSYEFSAALTNGTENAGDMEKFKVKLIGRRAYLAFRYKGCFYKSNKLAALLHPNPKGAEEGNIPTTYFSPHLCMPEDMERKPVLLPEEMYWLRYKIGYDVEDSIREAVSDFFTNILEEEIDNNNSLKNHELIRQGELFSLSELKVVLDFIANSKDLTPLLKVIENELQKYFADTKSRSLKNSQRELYVDLYNKYAISGVFDLLKSYGIKIPSIEDYNKHKVQDEVSLKRSYNIDSNDS